jgi:hypothetical protein
MKNLHPVINWFTERGGKYEGDSSPAFFDAESGSFSGEIEHTGNHELQFRGLQIFLTEDVYDTDEIKIVVQYLLEHGGSCDVDSFSIEDAIREIEPLLPENAEFEISHSVGIDVFLLRELSIEEMKPEKLDKILTPLTKFAEFATTQVSIIHLAPEFKLKKSPT